MTVKGHTRAILRQLVLLADKMVTSRRSMAKENPELVKKQFCDVNFKNLIRDPVGTVRAIYDQFGYEFTDEFERRINEYVENQDRSHRVSHSLDELDVTESQVEELFAPYIQDYSSYFGL